MTSHPAKFSDAVLENARPFIDQGWKVLDPFAGTGRVHEMTHAQTFGVELEPEWALMHPRTVVGNALALPFGNQVFDCVFTSPTYGNRMADHHDAKERCSLCEGEGKVAKNFGLYSIEVPEIVDCPKCEGKGFREYKRLTYRHQLGRPLHPDNSGQLQWGLKYCLFHVDAWDEVVRVLKRGGLFILNVSDHIRKGEIQPVVEWHKTHLRTSTELRYDGTVHVPTPRMRFGANSNLRVENEVLLLFTRPGLLARSRRDTMRKAESTALRGHIPQEFLMSDTSTVDTSLSDPTDSEDQPTAAPADSGPTAPVSPDSTGEVTPADSTDNTDEGEEADEKSRRPRGWLERDVKQITDQFVTGKITLADGEHLTPHRIARLVQKQDALDAPPSTGAVAAVLNRWVEIGFANTLTKPFAFLDYTELGLNEGLTALKEKRSANKKVARAEKKAAAAAAVETAAPAPEAAAIEATPEAPAVVPDAPDASNVVSAGGYNSELGF